MAAPLTADEKRRCLKFLRDLDITSPDHRILSDRGYFGLFLSGLHPEDVGKSEHPSIDEFRAIVRLLAKAGVDEIRAILESTTSSFEDTTPEPKPAPQAPTPAPTPQRASQGPPADLGDGKVNFTLPRKDTPLPQDIQDEMKAANKQPSQTGKSRAQFKRDIEVVRPPAKARERMRNLPHAETFEEAIAEARAQLELNHFHDAHHILAEYLTQKEISTFVISAINEVVTLASRHDRDRGIAPFNMLWECEETAMIVAKRIPDVQKLSHEGDTRTRMMYECVEIIYRTWTMHSKALLEYKFKANSKQWARRNWIEPRDLGFLVDIMKTAIRTHLPLDLLRFVYEQVHDVVLMMKNVIPHDDKQARFEGDVLRMIASPSKEIVPDLTFIIFKDIVEAYRREGDTQQAWTFCLQALLIHPHDREMLQTKEDLKDQGAYGIRREHQMKIHRRN